MYLWSLKGLLNHWRENKFTTSDSFHYFFGHVVLTAISNALYGDSGSERSWDSTTVAIAIVIVTIFLFFAYLILKSFYDANGGDEGKRFLDKLVSISFVVHVRLSVILAPCYFLISTFKEHAPLPILFLLLGGMLGACAYAFLAVSSSMRAIREV